MEMVQAAVVMLVVALVGGVVGTVAGMLMWPFIEAVLDRREGYPYGRKVDGDVLDHLAAWWRARRG